MSKQRNIRYSLLGGGGAAGSLLAGQGCLGACTGCFGCVAFGGVLVGLALVKAMTRDKGDRHGLAAADH